MWRHVSVLWLVLITFLAACAAPPAAPGAPANTSNEAPKPAAPVRILAAIRGTPPAMSQQKTQPSLGRVPGLDALEELVSAGLVHADDRGVFLPQLAEAVPSVDNGLWQVFADGRMTTTWKIRPTARWHDGAPFTSEDLVFTTTVEQDKEMGFTRNAAYDLIDRIEAPDPLTITVIWKQPFIEADTMFSSAGLFALPVPRHLLERASIEDKATIFELPYWTTEFIGSGAYRIKDWVTDSHVILQANDQYVLGRPKIDEIEVKFIPDPNTLMANVLAGVELTLGRALSLDQALRIRDQWPDGHANTRPYGWVPMSVQFINPNPPIVGDVRFRRAMVQAIDRQQLVDTLMAGQTSIAHSFVNPDLPEYAAIESSIVRYPYDPRASVQLLEELGYARRSDSFFYDAAGQKLSLQVYTTIQNEMHPKAIAAVADFWQQVGVSVEQVIIPVQRAADREYRATFPTFELVERPSDLTSRTIVGFHGNSTPLPENRFSVVGNVSRYRNAELDSYIDRYVTTIPRPERLQALGQIVHHQTDQLTQLGLINTVTPTLVSNRIENITGKASRGTEAWNAQEWSVRN